MAFPVEAVPDGTVMAPHHVYIGGLLVVLAALPTIDDHSDREPMAALCGAVTACLAFLFVWRLYPVVGAALTFAFTLVACVAPVWFPFWQRYAWRGSRGLVLLGALIMLDDVVSHAFGVPTPLDTWLWKPIIYPVMA